LLGAPDSRDWRNNGSFFPNALRDVQDGTALLVALVQFKGYGEVIGEP
jgi:hypothetical protein